MKAAELYAAEIDPNMALSGAASCNIYDIDAFNYRDFEIIAFVAEIDFLDI